MKTSKLLFALIVIYCVLFCVQSVVAQDDIPWLSNYTSEITVGSYTCSYSFKAIDNNPCKISIEEKKTDKKGVSTTMIYQFYLSDINTSSLKFKTSGSAAIVNMDIRLSQKFIRVFKNGELQGYDQNVEINMSEVDKARSFIDAMKSNIENCKSIERRWTSYDETIQWICNNIGKSEASGTVYNQSFKRGGKSYLVSFESLSTDAKGVTQNQTYDFNLYDINPVKINMEVSGKIFKIELPVRENNYYIRLKKGADETSYVKAFEIYSDDVEQARNIFNGLVYLVNETPAPVWKKWESYSAALNFVKENINEVKSGTSTLGQSFSFDASPSGIAQFSVTKKDSKGVAVQNIKSFYFNDIQPAITIEASSKSVTVNLSTKEKNKYIKESNENGISAYSNSIEIFGTDLDVARELAHALEYAVEKGEKGLKEFAGTENAISWVTSNVDEVKIDKETISQTIKVLSNDENKIELKVVTTPENGTGVVDFFEIYPEDIKLDNTKIKVSGKKLAVVVSAGKLKYIKYLKDDVLQNYASDFEILFDDVLKAKNFVNAITMLHNKSLVADRSLNVKATAWSYIMENTKKMDTAGNTVDQKIDQRDGEPCKGKFTLIETSSKGVSVENIFEFSLSDIDLTNSEIVVSSKSLKITLVTRNKEKIIKPYKNGEAGNFVSSIDIYIDNVLVAKKMLAAFGSLAGLCK